MKTNYHIVAGILILFLLQPFVIFSQETEQDEEQPPIIVVTKAHWTYDLEEGSNEEWLATEKEFFDKVTANNEYILASGVLMHLLTEDASEILFVRSCKTWDDIEKAAERDSELAKEAWPDKDERSAFFKNQSKYYASKHSDELYQALKGAKFMTEEKPEESLVYYMRVNHLAFPEDSKPGEIEELYGEFTENITHKNPHILAYYPMTHLYGADSRDFVEIFVVKSLADLEKALDNSDLIKSHWPDEDSRKEFFDKYRKYFTGWHADYVYSNVPELMK